ncbi:MAG: site-2 protease family protein [Betaproteobacteria bacterium]
MDFSLATIVLWAVPVVFAITLHEAAHGYVAKLFGDNTAQALGRVTLNPIKHIDPIGTILVPGLMLLTSKFLVGVPFVFGWAKPVPVNFGNLRHPKRDMIWVAAAGPAVNFAMAILWALFGRMTAPSGAWVSDGLHQMSQIGIGINLVLMVLNLLPIPPLDGGRIVTGLLPLPAARVFARIEPFGFPLILLLLFVGWLDKLMSPLLRVAAFALHALTGA